MRKGMRRPSRYVALLRGINVGGKNIIAMSALKTCLENAGLREVVTYIQSGNALFNHPRTHKEALETKIEQAIFRRFKCASRVLPLSSGELENIVKRAPAGFGKKPEEFRYDVIFLMKPLTAEEALRQIKIKEGVDEAHSGPGVLYFSRLIKKASQSRLSRVVQLPIYQQMTIRNWNTASKLLALLKG